MKRLYLPLIIVIIGISLSGCRWFADNPMFPTAKMDISTSFLDENGNVISNGSVGALSVTTIDTTDSSSNTSDTSASQNIDTIEVIGTTNQVTTTIETSNASTSTTSTSNASTTNTSISYARDVEFTFHSLNNVGAEITQCIVQYKKLNGSLISDLTKNLDVFISVVPATEPIAAVYTQEKASIVVEIFDPVVENYLVSNGIRQAQAEVTFYGTDFAGHQVFYKKAVYIKAY